MAVPKNIGVPASNYTHDELAEIYNHTRIDYIVPMPMNAKRMRQYVEHYDVDLNESVVVTTEDGEPIGVGMLGLRDNRAWITRLGVVPNMRERRIGTFLMKLLIDNAQRCGVALIQLEVIVGNDPAFNMFRKFGFQLHRELLVVRRPPKQHVEGSHPLVHELRYLEDDEIVACLQQREPGPSWVEETTSLLNAGALKGLLLRIGDAEGWVVFMCTKFQIQHIVLWANGINDDDVVFSLLYYLHELFPNRDTKVENIPVNHPTWRAFESLDYVVDFRRYEMLLEV